MGGWRRVGGCGLIPDGCVGGLVGVGGLLEVWMVRGRLGECPTRRVRVLRVDAGRIRRLLEMVWRGVVW